MPSYDWGLQNIQYSPKTDVGASKMRRIIDRDLNMPVNDISTIDPMRMKEVDDLYKVRLQIETTNAIIFKLLTKMSNYFPMFCLF